MKFDAPAVLEFTPKAPVKLPPAWKAVGVPKRLAFRDKPAKRVFYNFADVDNAVALIERLPVPGETIHAIMNSTFKGVDLCPAIVRLAGRPCQEFVVTTLGFNRADAACLCEMKARGDIQTLALVCSNFFAEKDRAAYAYAQKVFAEVGARIAVSRNHSKILLFDFGDTHFVVESSANLRSCNNLEQFTLTNSTDLWSFHRSWIIKML